MGLEHLYSSKRTSWFRGHYITYLNNAQLSRSPSKNYHGFASSLHFSPKKCLVSHVFQIQIFPVKNIYCMFYEKHTSFFSGKNLPPGSPPLIPPSWSWNLRCNRCSETRSMRPSPSTPEIDRWGKVQDTSALINPFDFAVTAPIGAWTCTPPILGGNAPTSLQNNEKNQQTNSWATILWCIVWLYMVRLNVVITHERNKIFRKCRGNFIIMTKSLDLSHHNVSNDTI